MQRHAAALRKYNAITHKSVPDINGFLKNCSRLKFPEKLIGLIWSDIVKINKSKDSDTGKDFYYGLILKHCVKDSNQCIQTLQWIEKFDCYNEKDIKHYSNGISRIIKSCDDYHELNQISLFIQKLGMKNDIHINMALLTAFNKCSNCNSNVIDDIINIFNMNNNKDTKFIGATLNALINNDGYINVLNICNDNKYSSFMDNICYSFAIKACIGLNDYEKGKQFAKKIILSDGYNHDLNLKTTLIDFYGHFGDILICEKIFNSLMNHQINIILTGVMMKVYINNDCPQKALLLYDKYDNNLITHGLALKACINCNDFQKGKSIHSKLIKQNDKFIDGKFASRLIDFYGHFGEIFIAENIFKSMSNNQIDSFMINSMMNVYLNNTGDYHKILEIYKNFKSRSILNEVSHNIALTACIKMDNAKEGKEIIKNEMKHIYRLRNVNLLSTLINFHGHFGKYTESFYIWNIIPENKKTTKILNCLINVCFNHNHFDTILNLFDKYSSLRDDVTYLLTIKSCLKLKNMEKGKEICNKIDLNKCGINIKSVLIEFLNEFGLIDIAKNVFDTVKNEEKDSILIGIMMKTFIDNDQSQNALNLYYQYQYLQNNHLHCLAIKACIKLNDYKRGQQIECDLKDDDDDIYIKTALIDLYGNIGDIDKARQIFNYHKNKQNIVIYNAMMDSYLNCKMYQNVIDLFNEIFNGKTPEIFPDVISYIIVLKACIESTNYHFGKIIHEHLKRNKKENWILSEISIQICLINFYGKCGMLENCEDIFNEIKEKDDISIYNAMINGYGRNGESDKGYQLYKKMKIINNKTYIQLINGFNHSGNIEKAIKIWKYEINDKNIKYDKYVVTTLIDCLSRNGMIIDALKIIKEYEKYNDNNNNINYHHNSMWISILNGCILYKEYNTGYKIYDEIILRFPNDKNTLMSCTALLQKLDTQKKTFVSQDV